MAIDVFLPAAWQRLGVAERHLRFEGDSLHGLLGDLKQRWPLLAGHWLRPDGTPMNQLQLFVNGEPVPPRADLALRDGDAVDLLLPISGG